LGDSTPMGARGPALTWADRRQDRLGGSSCTAGHPL